MIKIVTDPNFILSISFVIFLILFAKKIFMIVVAALDKKIAEISKDINSSQKDFLDASTSLDDMNIENEKIKQKKVSLEKDWKEDLVHEIAAYKKSMLEESNKILNEKEYLLIQKKEEELKNDIKQVIFVSVNTLTGILQSNTSEINHSKLIDNSITKLKQLI